MPGRRGPGAGALVREVPGDLSVWSEMTSATPAAFRPVPLILVAVAVVCGALACRMLGLGEGVLLVAAPASGMALAAALVLRWKGALAATAGFLLAGAIWGLAPGDLVADTLGHGLAALVGAQAMRMLARRRRIETKTREWLIFVAGVAAFTATIVAVLALAELAGALAVPPPPPLTPLLAAVFEPLGILTFCTVLGNFHEFRQIRADPRPTVGIAALAVVLLGLLWALLELPPEIVNRSGVTLLLSVPFCLWVAMQQRSLDGGVLSYLAALAALVIVRREVPSVLHPDFIATVVYLSLLVLVCQLVHAVNLDRLLALAEVEGHKRELEARVAERTEKLSAMTERALAADAAKTRFMATVSHEVRTPLNGVIGMASVVLAGDLDERTRRNVAMIRTSGFHLLDVINRILDFSKLEHSEAVDEITVFDLRELIEEVVVEARFSSHSEGIEIGATIDRDVAVIRRGYRQGLRQILTNLVGNAAKFTDAGSVRVRVRALGGAWLRIEVRDTGVGIAEEQKERIFLPFEQADGSMTRRHGGTGLGLAICAEMTRRMGGRIGVESAPGKGSLFWVELSLPAAAPEEPAQAETVAAGGAA